MNVYCKGVFKEMDLAINSIIKLIDTLNEGDLNIRPTEGKWSIGELLSHISVLCKADFLIGAGASEEEMDHFYEEAEPEANRKAIANALIYNYSYLKKGIGRLMEEELLQETTSFFGVVHSRYEWLLDTQAHLFHHRGQLHSMIVHILKLEPNVQLFE
ncbi:DinB family protein [Paenibacillus sp. BSR1-1]|uniref:DinB family protein n=1 Tax=Paenibacillus sp. BSR1-1 TaxID=3020845 RepID=UPI0025B219CB|nr:DinB family protein [Paenibacillus sp. BSR1-1]MDN3019937.1 DinB family protein [Paenibacillus sp. BSR1-1]